MKFSKSAVQSRKRCPERKAWNNGCGGMVYEMPYGLACFRFAKAYTRDYRTGRMHFK